MIIYIPTTHTSSQQMTHVNMFIVINVMEKDIPSTASGTSFKWLSLHFRWSLLKMFLHLKNVDKFTHTRT